MACEYAPYECDLDSVFDTPCDACLGSLLDTDTPNIIQIRPGVWVDQTEPSVFLRLLRKKKGPAPKDEP